MRASFLSLAAFVLPALAFPSALLKGDISQAELKKITELAEKITSTSQKRQAGLNIVDVGFDAEAQRVDTSGEHEYRAPGSGDIRGPCPGLNAMANHGYLNRNGLTNVVEATLASQTVFGMGLDLGGFLSAYSGIMAGDITSFSIGGPPSSGLIGGLTSSLGLLGRPQGLSKSHNRFETDASPLRADLYKTNDPVSLNLEQFTQLANMPLGPNGYDLSVMFPFRAARFQNSVSTNGRFFVGPFTQFAVNTATYVFTYRFFANHSAEYPDGYLNLESLMSFEGVTQGENGFEWESGRERIPENWYRRAPGNDFGLAAFAVDALANLQATPQLAVIGGNTGEPNTFTGVNVGDLTGGVFNAETLLDGNNALCFAFQAMSMAAPDILRGLVGNVLQAVDELAGVLTPIIGSLGCPELAAYDDTAFGKYPGWSETSS